jgi:hypothetical protein
MVEYLKMVESVKSAVKTGETLESKWVAVGSDVSAFFGNEKALEEVKAQFVADCILPAINAKHSKALAVDLPRKNSKEYNENISKDASYSDKFEIANQAKKDARSTCETYYKRIVKYAFPKEKTDGTKKDFVARLSKLIEDGGKIKECNFDLVATLQFLVQAEKVAKTPIL